MHSHSTASDHPYVTGALSLLLLLGLAAILASIPELRRYLRIRAM